MKYTNRKYTNRKYTNRKYKNRKYKNRSLTFFVTLLSFISLNMFTCGSFALSISLTSKSLDNAWDERQSKESQSDILNFILNEPNIPDDFEVAWRISRLVYFIGNFGVGERLNNHELMRVFEVGYKAAEHAKKLEPKRVEGYYWYAINLGKYGLAKGVFSALAGAAPGRDALLEAIKLDPSYHWGGPYRILGRYYQDLPPGISFGDKKKAKEYFNKSIEIAPDFRLNSTYLAILEKDSKLKRKILASAESKPDKDGLTEEIRYKALIESEIQKIK